MLIERLDRTAWKLEQARERMITSVKVVEIRV
jgi:hypothetical protein